MEIYPNFVLSYPNLENLIEPLLFMSYDNGISNFALVQGWPYVIKVSF
jgi:hypothetical protein